MRIWLSSCLVLALFAACVNDVENFSAKFSVNSLSLVVESNSIVRISGSGFDTSLSLAWNGRLLPMDSLSAGEITFHAPWPRGDYEIWLTNGTDSLSAAQLTVTRTDQLSLTDLDGWYIMPEGRFNFVKSWTLTPKLSDQTKLYRWKSNSDGSYSQVPLRVDSVNQWDHTTWIHLYDDTISAGAPYECDYGGYFRNNRTSLERFFRKSFFKIYSPPGPHTYESWSDNLSTLLSMDLQLRREGDTIVATAQGNFCGQYRMETWKSGDTSAPRVGWEGMPGPYSSISIRLLRKE